MEVKRQISIPAPTEKVWLFVSDLVTVLTCVPGAKLGAAKGDGTYEATISVQAGDFGVSFGGTTRLEVEGPNTAVIHAKGRDGMGSIHAEARIRVNVEGAGEAASLVDVVAEFDFSGVLAPAARAGGQPAANLLMKKFTACLSTRLS